MDERLQHLVEVFFRTLNDRDEKAHAALYDPTVTYFGSVSGLQDQGIGLIRGVFRAAWNSYGVRRCVPRKSFGQWPEIAVIVDMFGGTGPDPVPVTEGVFYMTLAEDGRIRKLSLLWDFGPMAKLLSRGDPGGKA